jgi:hypothetical protein
MFLWGLFFRYLFDVFLRYRQSPAYVFLYALSLAWVIFLMRLDFVGGLKGYLVTALIPALPALFWLRPRRSRQ